MDGCMYVCVGGREPTPTCYTEHGNQVRGLGPGTRDMEQERGRKTNEVCSMECGVHMLPLDSSNTYGAIRAKYRA